MQLYINALDNLQEPLSTEVGQPFQMRRIWADFSKSAIVFKLMT